MPTVVSIPDGRARIAIGRRSLIKDTLRSYSIHVDGVRVGRLWPLRTGRYDVLPGHHEISVRVGNRTSAGVQLTSVELAVGQTRAFRVVGPRVILDWRAFPGFGFLTWRPGPWIVLRPLPPFANDSSQPMPGGHGLVSQKAVHDIIRHSELSRSARGYDPEQVDAFVASVESRVTLGAQIPSAEFADVTFDHVLRGYTYVDVDQLLTRLATRFGSGH
jgi:DivIVA domain-containing protein